MALSGTFYTNVGARWRLQSEWSATQNISANTSTITVKTYWMSLDQNGAVYSSATKTGATTITGGSPTATDTFSTTAGLSANQKKLIHTHTATVTHGSDGTKSVALSGYFDVEVSLSGTTYNRVSVSGTATLNTIPRASSQTSDANWVAGSSKAVSISRASSSFTHTVKMYVNAVLVKTATGVGSSITMAFSTAENTAVFKQLATASSKTTSIEILTYSDGTLIGTTSKTGIVTSPSASTINNADRSVYIDDPLTIGITRANTGFTHTLKIYSNTTLIKTVTGVTTSYDWTPSVAEMNAMYASTPNANSVDGNIEVITYYGIEQVKTSTANDMNFYVRNSKPTFGTGYTYADTNTVTTALTGNNQMIVQNKSTVTVTLLTASKAVAINGATMVNYSATLNGVEKISAFSSTGTVTFVFGAVNQSTDVTLSIKAIDSRGNYTTTTKTVTMLPYNSPTLNATASRLSSFENSTTLRLNGVISLLPVSAVNKNSVQTVKYRYKEKTATGVISTWDTWSSFVFSTSVATYTANNITLDLDNTKTYTVEFQTTDKLGTVTTSVTVATGTPLMFIDSKLKSVGVNKFPTGTGSLEVAGGIETNYLNINNTGDTSPTTSNVGLRIGSETGLSLKMDGNEIIAQNNGVSDDLHLQPEGGTGRIVMFNNDTGKSIAFSDGGMKLTNAIQANGQSLATIRDGTTIHNDHMMIQNVIVNVPTANLPQNYVDFTFPIAFSSAPIWIISVPSGTNSTVYKSAIYTPTTTGGRLYINHIHNTAYNGTIEVTVVACGRKK